MVDVIVASLQLASVALLAWGAIISLSFIGRIPECRRHMFDDAGPIASMCREDFPVHIQRPPLRALRPLEA